MGSRADLRQYGKFIAPLVAKEVAKANAMAESEGLESIKSILEKFSRPVGKESKARREGLLNSQI